MLIHYAYIKPRSQFGKQCFFEKTDPIVEENMLPDPALMRNYVHRSHCHREVQRSEQFALHEMQTVRKVTKEMGMLHSEGGWPKEINVKDEEAVQRFRRRVEKDENWVPRMKKLTDPMENYILQNSTINIYENYFDDMVPTALVLPRGVRTSNVYADPQPVVRPISHLSWSPDKQNRLAASYSFTEFETQRPLDVNLWSYIWDIENPNTPLMCLRPSSPLMTIEFNPRDPSMLISGLMSGQVCNWDIRIGNRPVQMSHRQFSHRNPANQALWITSKLNTEFFSASTDGTIKWWDIRKLRQPIDELVMDLDDPLHADVVKAIGVATLHFEPSFGSRFMAGMENGVVINANRRAANRADMLATRFNCHVGPVIAIDRNPLVPKNFLTVSDWTVKIWADDTREGSLVAIREQNADLSGGCWSRSRYSVFFTINVTGLLEVYDILTGVDSPVTTFRVCNERLTAIEPHEDGRFLAVGSHDGNIHLVECSEGHTVNTRTDKANFTAYLERCSRFVKTVDARMKEVRLMRASVREDIAADLSAAASKGRHKKKNSNHRDRNRAQAKEKSEQLKKKSRLKRTTRDDAFFADDAGLTESEAEYFRAVERELASYPSLENFDVERMASLEQEISRKKKKREPTKVEVEPEVQLAQEQLVIKRERARATKLRSPTSKPDTVLRVEKAVATEAVEVPVAEPRETTVKRGGRARKIPGGVCTIAVCKPEICRAEEKRKTKLQDQLAPKGKKRSQEALSTPRSRKLRDFVQKLPERSAVWKRKIPLEGDGSLADVLADEVEEARGEARAWQKRLASGKRDFWRSLRASEKPEGEKRVGNGGDKSPARNARERSLDFRRSVETSSRRKSGSEDDGDRTSRARGKREARKSDPRLEKRAQKNETGPTLPASSYSDDATKDAITRITATMTTVTSTTTTTMTTTTTTTTTTTATVPTQRK